MTLAPGDVERLLDALCADLGFCLRHAERSRLVERPPDDAATFANEVFLAEGLNPELADRHLYRQVRDRIAEAMRQFNTQR